MQCTYFHKKYKDLEAQELRELAAAVKAHGGEYIFVDCSSADADEEWFNREDKDEVPLVLGAYQYMDRDEYFYISRVKLREDGTPRIYGFRDEYGDPSDETLLDTIHFGYINEIISAIPDTDEVHDVRELPPISFLPVLSLSRDDVETIGFDPEMDDDTFTRLANSVSKHLDIDDFWLSLEYAAEHIGLKRKEADNA